MTSKTEIHLTREHQVIHRVLTAFERYLEELEQAPQGTPSPRLAPAQLWRVIDYLGESLFLRHEEKEEGALLPELARNGHSWTDGTLSHVRKEHRHGRYLMRSLRHAIHQRREWTQDNRRHFLSIGREWILFLRRHMAAEEQLLFPQLGTALSSEQHDALVAQFEAIDADFEEMKDAHELRAAGEAFVENYGTAPTGQA